MGHENPSVDSGPAAGPHPFLFVPGNNMGHENPSVDPCLGRGIPGIGSVLWCSLPGLVARGVIPVGLVARGAVPVGLVARGVVPGRRRQDSPPQSPGIFFFSV